MNDPSDYGVPILVAAPRGHRPRLGKHARLMMPGATVDVKTHRQAKAWRGRGKRQISLGILFDQLFAFAKKKGFAPKLTK